MKNCAVENAPKEVLQETIRVSMGCRSLSVLHLSDLHISGTALAEKYYDLVADIKCQTRNLRDIVLVITGDIGNQGDVLASQGAILQFFTELKKALDSKVIDVEIVPGNHDIQRDYLISTDEYSVALKNYLAIANRIISIFGIQRVLDKAFGTNVIDCGGRSICFVRTDTSWYFEGKPFAKYVQTYYAKQQLEESEIDKKTKVLRACKNARVEEYILRQTKFIVDQINLERERARQKGSPIELVVALAHHPLSWLMKSTRESYADFLGNHSLPEFDIWMCGHAHDVKIHYDNDDNQSMVVLMSGVGSEEQRRSVHRYSLYHLSMTRNVCSIQVRASLSKGVFKEDSSLLPTETSYTTGHYCYPLRAKTPGSIIQLNTYDGNPKMEFYADQHALLMMQKLMERLMDLGAKLTTTIAVQKAMYKCGPKNVTSGEKFANFLSRVCDDIVSALVMQTADVGRLADMPLFEEGANVWATKWRAHFRAILPESKSRQNGVYRSIAHSGGLTKWCSNETQSGLHDIEWESLIKGAFTHDRKMMVRSVNDYPGSRRTSWDDYITTVINIPQNVYRGKVGVRPILTFGLSAKSENYESSVMACRFLYLLEFFNLDRIVSLCVRSFLEETSFDLSDLLKRKR